MAGKLPKAKIVVEAFALCCPKCGEPQPERRTGSEKWTAEDLPHNVETLLCMMCGTEMAVPKSTTQLLGGVTTRG